MRHSLRRFSSLFTLILLAGMALSACNVPGFNTSTGSSASGNSDNMKIKLGQISKSVAYFPFYVAEQQGFFKKEGLTLDGTPSILGTGAKVAQAIEAGDLDIGGGVMSDAFNLATKDSSARVIGALVNGYYVDITVSNSFATQTGLTEKSTLAQKVQALKGKKIGITGPGSGTSALLVYLFRQQGLDANKDITMVNLGSTSTAALAALQSGKVDALSFFSPVGPTAVSKGIGQIFISPDTGDVPALNGDVHGAFYTKQSIIDAKPKTIAAFIKGVADAEAFIQNPSDKAKAEALLATFLTLTPKAAANIYTSMLPVWSPNPTISQSAYNISAQFHVAAGLISAAPTYNSIVAENTISAAIK